MTIHNLSLNKCLKLLCLDDKKVISALREDIRLEIKKESGEDMGGGDFYISFWRDAKDHVAGTLDLSTQTKLRIDKHKGRANLYPRLATGFMTWWLEKRRWSNLDFQFVDRSISGKADIKDIDALIRVGGMMSLKVSDGSYRLIYPFFCKDAALNDETARIGLWLMHNALKQYPISDMRILDVIRAKSFSVQDHPLQGNEAALFKAHFKHLKGKWDELRTEYPPFAA